VIHLTVDGREVEVPEGTLILDAAKEVGADVPTFCYHHLMKPVAACRMCLVEVEKRPKLEPACAVAVAEGMVVHTGGERVTRAREGVLEFLLAQHPLDCPVCDKGGECDLQDNTMNHGRFRTRYEDAKIKKNKHLPLSDLVLLDEERCIVCQRCTRFM
jgi:NADH-quinone oxidoreductase subunit G